MKPSSRSKTRRAKAKTAQAHSWQPMPTYCSFGALVMSGVLTLANPALAQKPGTVLPPGMLPIALRDKSGALIGASGISAIRYSTNLLEVDQSDRRAIMNWGQFNVGRAAEVRFNQKSATDSILNRIWDVDPSIIQGKISGKGQIYLINRNGIIFDGGSQTNVGSLLASTLNMRDQDFLDGFAKGASNTEATESTFTKFSDTWQGVGVAPEGGTPIWLDGNGNPKATTGKPGSILVNLYGPASDDAGKLTDAATLSAAPGGSIILIAPKIENRGVITSPDGQVILAAGEKAYLWVRNTDAVDPKSAALRGLMVEISADEGDVNITSYVRNLGTISSDRGNVTLAALAIKQDGRVTAGSSAVLNGSIWLTARSITEPGGTTLKDSDNGTRVLDGKRGEVVFGAGSFTGTPLLTDSGRLAESASYSNFATTTKQGDLTINVKRDYRSWIHVVAAGEDGTNNGGRIHNQGTIEALGGTIDFLALGQGSRILLDKGSTVSAAGNWVTRQMSDNIVTIQRLTSNYLQDSPVAKAGPLLFASVAVDARKGSKLFDVSAFTDNIQRTVQDKATAGGDIKLEARGGDVISVSGSKVDVSGGGFRYQSGEYRTTKLLGADGKVYDISDASPLRTYTAVGGGVSRTYFKAGPMGWKQTQTWASRLAGNPVFESAYVQGADAGTLTVIAPNGVSQGDWTGGITAGRYQVNLTDGSGFPKGGTLTVGESHPSNASVDSISFGTATALPDDFGLDTDLPAATADKGVILPGEQFRFSGVQSERYSYSGFGTLDLHANQSIVVPAGVNVALAPGGTFQATAPNGAGNSSIVLEAAHDGLAGGSITAPAGKVSLSAKSVSIGGAQYGTDGSVKAAGASINASGVVMADARPHDAIAAGGGFAAKPGDDLNGYLENNLSALLDDMSKSGKSVVTGAVAAPAFAVNATTSGDAISVNSTGGALQIDKGASLSAMGGLRLATDNSIVAGNGGGISLTGLSLPSGGAPATAPQALGINLYGYALGKGGKLSIDAGSVKVTSAIDGTPLAADSASGALLVGPAFFRKGGFTSYSLTGQSGMNIAAETVLKPAARGLDVQALRLARQDGARTSGFDVDTAAAGIGGVNATVAGGNGANRLALDVHLREKLAGERAPTSLSFKLSEGSGGRDFVFSEGAEIRTDPLASVSFAASVKDTLTDLALLGRVYAPGGHISATLRGPTLTATDPGYDASNPDAPEQNPVIRIGSSAQLNTAGVFVAKSGGSEAFGLTRDANGNLSRRERVQGSVTSGGSITLDATGSAGILADAGSVLDVSAASATVDAPGDAQGRIYVPKPIWSDAGSIEIKSTEATRIDSTLHAEARGQGLGGAFSMEFDSNTLASDAPRLPFDNRIVVTQGRPDTAPRTSSGGAPYITSRVSADKLNAGGFSSVALSSDHSIEFSGDVALNAAQTLKVDAPVIEARSAPGSSSTTHVALNSDRVILSNTTGVPSQTNATLPPTSLATELGNATLAAHARLIDVVGSVTVNGLQSGRAPGGAETSPLLLDSRSDIRLTGLPVKLGTTSNSAQVVDALVGGLTSESNIELRAQQVYPTTMSQFTVASVQVASAGAPATPVGSVRVTRNPGAAQETLSAGGKLVLTGDKVIQGGTVKAPLGRIELNGREVQLAAGSLTSVSLSGLTVPLGETTNAGRTWFYRLAAGSDGQGYDKNSAIDLSSPGEKQIIAKGDSVEIDQGAVVDLSGGGDVQAFEFIPGPGGSKDVLQTSATAQTWGILPGTRLSDAPVDTSLAARNNASTAVAGSPYNKIYISGAAGLADGWYPLLDAHYALLPGAYQVATVSDTKLSNLPLGRVGALLDGTPVISAYLGVAGSTARQSTTSGYVVRTGEAARAYSEFKISNSDFFATQASNKDLVAPRLPLDAGGLTLAPLRILALDGTLKSKSAAGGRAAEIDISSELLAVTDQAGAAAPQYLSEALADLQSRGVVGSDAQFVQVSAQALSELDGSLLLGGARSADGRLDTAAKQVVVANSAGTALRAAEVMLSASDKIDVRSGAVIDGTRAGTLTRTALSTNGDGAFLRASSGEQLTLARSNVTRAGGVLDVHSGANVSGKSIVLDATKTASLSGNLIQPAGGALSLASGAVALGEVPVGLADTLALDQGKLAALGTLGDVAIRSYSSIDLYGRATVGSSELKALTLDARELVGYRARDAKGQAVGQANQASLTAQTLTLRNQSSTDLAATTPDGDGSLSINAQRLVFGAGDKGIRGFGAVTANAAVEVAQAGKGTTTVAGDFNLVTPRVVSTARADQVLRAANYADDQHFALNVSQPAAVAAANVLPSAAGPGGRWGFVGSKISFATTLDAPSSQVEMTARGTQASDDVSIGSGANVKVNGYAKQFTDASAYASAGSVSLVSSAGNVSIAEGATVDFSAASGGGDAGKLSVVASQGTASISGSVLGAAGVGESGKVAIDAATLNDLDQINTQLNTGKVEGERVFRQRQGDVQLAAATTVNTVKAKHVSISADAGSIGLNGTIDASSVLGGGRVELYAKQDVKLNTGSRVDASGTSTGSASGDAYADGGTVELVAGRDLVFASGATVDISAGAKGDGGKLTFAGSRNANGNLARTMDLKGTVIAQPGVGGKAAQVVVRGDARYELASVDASVTTAAAGNAIWEQYRDFMQSASALRTGLNINQAGGLQIKDKSGVFIDESVVGVRAGIEIDSAGDLKLESDWDLTAGSADGTGWNIGGTPGLVTLRASGNLDISHQLGLVDGQVFDDIGQSHMVADDRLPNGESWSIRLASGSDQSAADPLALASKVALLTAGTGDTIVRDDGDGSGQVGKVRTGTGSIEMAVGRDLLIGSEAGDHAVVYSAGRSAETVNPVTGQAETIARYTDGGGDIRISVQGNALGALKSGGDEKQFINDWLRRTTVASFDANDILNASGGWWVFRPNFRSGIGSFGGGDIALEVGGDIRNLGTYSASSGLASWEGGDGLAPVTPTELVVRGGGDLRVAAGGNISNGEYLVSLGKGMVKANGNAGTNDLPVSAFVMGRGSDPARSGASMRIEGGGDVSVKSVSNPTILPLTYSSNTLGTDDLSFAPSEFAIYGFGNQRSAFFSYAPTSSAEIVSVAGDVALGRSQTLTRPNWLQGPVIGADGASSQVAPAQLALVAMNGNVSQIYTDTEKESTAYAASRIELYPSENSRAVVLAGKDVSRVNLRALNVDPAVLPQSAHPQVLNTDSGFDSTGLFSTTATRIGVAPAADGQRNFVAEAQTGDVIASRFSFPDSASVRAGRDVVATILELQNLHGEGQSEVVAGRDISLDSARYPGLIDANVPFGIQVAGTGTALIQAGRNIDLGDSLSRGILADGNARNKSLASANSARVIVISGVQGKVEVATVDALMPAVKLFGILGDGNSAAMAREVGTEISAVQAATDKDAALESLEKALAALAGSGKTAEIRKAASAAGDAIAAARKSVAAGQPQALIDQLLAGLSRMAAVNTFNGSAVIAASTAAAKGVVDAAFAGNTVGPGNIDLFSTRIQTTGDSAIDLLAPGFDAQGRAAGNINAGLPAGEGGDIGITTLAGGGIRAFLSGDFNVNRSKVLTGQTGDIMLYSSDGSIDAGRGATTSVSTSPPRRVALTDEEGNVVGFTYLSPTDVAGSGIRTASSDPDGAGPQTTPKPGSIFLFAPKGTIDAGEAGIDSAGDVTIRAVTVLNANAISAAGSSSGVPPPDTGGLGALATAANPTSSNNKQTEDAGNALAGKSTANQNSLKPTIIIVEVLGYGDDSEERNRKR